MNYFCNDCKNIKKNYEYNNEKHMCNDCYNKIKPRICVVCDYTVLGDKWCHEYGMCLKCSTCPSCDKIKKSLSYYSKNGYCEECDELDKEILKECDKEDKLDTKNQRNIYIMIDENNKITCTIIEYWDDKCIGYWMTETLFKIKYKNIDDFMKQSLTINRTLKRVY